MFGQRTEDRGPIRRYKKGRPDRKKRAGSVQAANNADAGIGGAPTVTQSSIPVTSTPILPPPASLEAQLVSDVSGSPLRTVITVGIFLACIAAIAIPLISVGNTIRSIGQPAFPKVGPTPTPARTSAGPKTGAAPKEGSYLTAAGARAGLAHIATLAPGARVSLLRIDATSISAIAQLADGTSKLIAIEPTGVFVQLTPASGERPIPISQIRPTVVAKLVAEMNRRFHVPADRIDYMVLNSAPGLPLHWVLFSKAPSHPAFTASLSGGRLARLPG